MRPRVQITIQLVLFAAFSAAVAPATEPLLEPGAGIEGRLDEGESKSFRVALLAGQLRRLWLDEGAVDLVLIVEPPDGGSAGEVGVDSPVKSPGIERYLFLSGDPGTYRVRVRARAGASGFATFRLRLEEASDAEDRRWLEAEVEMVRAAELNFLGGTGALVRAIEHYRRARALWQQLAAPRLEAEALQGMGALQRRLGDSRASIEALDEALEISRHLGETARQAGVLNGLGLSHWLLGEVDAARFHLEQALTLWRQLGDRRGEANSLNSLCLTHQQRGELEDALDCYRSARNLYRTLEDRGGEARVLNNIGSIYSGRGEPRLALEYFDRALELYRRVGLQHPQVHTLNNIAVLHRRTGKIQSALRQYEALLELQDQIDDLRGRARTLNNLGRAYLSLGEAGRAQTYFERALPLRRQVEDRRGEAATLNNLGQVYRRQGRLDEALELHRQALQLAESLQLQKSRVVALTELGRGWMARGEPSRALGRLDEARDALEGSGDRLQLANVLTVRGRAHLLAGDLPQAAESLQRALTLSDLAGYREGEIQALHALAEVEYAKGRLDTAQDHIDAALLRIENLRTRLSSPDLRASYLGAERGAYELAIDISMALAQREPAAGHELRGLALSERARARSLLEILQGADTELTGRAAAPLRQRREELEQRLNGKAHQRLAFEKSSSRALELEAEILVLLGELENVEAEIRRQHPGYATLMMPPSPTPETYFELLDPQTVLLEVALSRDGGYLWWISGGEISGYPLAATRAEIETAAREAYRQLSTLTLRGSADRAAALGTLSRILLGPVADRLLDQRLVIVADGPLNYIPFAALPLPGVEQVPLLERHEVVHLPSATVLAFQRREIAGRRSGSKRAAILADPVFDPLDPRLGPTVRPAARRAVDRAPLLERLPATRKEAQAIARLAPAGEVMTALDFDASRATALSDRLAEYRIVHFATHGLLDAETPRLSGLALSQLDEKGRLQEGFLRLHDIYKMNLTAELAVLSGCQTALGKEIRGEGLIGLTRGFMYAGIPRVVASLWRVEEQATAELMEHFYRGMWDRQLTAAAALRAAQIAIRKQRKWREPYFWAAFVLQGEWL